MYKENGEVIRALVFLDKGADCPYINSTFVHKTGHTRKRIPSGPHKVCDVAGNVITEVFEMVTVKISFGKHVELHNFHIMQLYSMDLLLGYDWISLHAPDRRKDKNGFPIFDHPECVNHTKENLNKKLVNVITTRDTDVSMTIRRIYTENTDITLRPPPEPTTLRLPQTDNVVNMGQLSETHSTDPPPQHWNTAALTNQIWS